MPNCFQLLRDGAAVPLAAIDEEMCRHFESPCHPIYYYANWYDTIGYKLAMGQSFDQIRETLTAYPQLVKIANWLEQNFAVSSWYERKGYERNP
jgi:hypothetical protein